MPIRLQSGVLQLLNSEEVVPLLGAVCKMFIQQG